MVVAEEAVSERDRETDRQTEREKERVSVKRPLSVMSWITC